MASAVDFRHFLHANPEISSEEIETSNYVVSELSKLGLGKIHRGFSMHSVLVEIANQAGPTILFRCELDALPIEEENIFAHKSKNKGVSHKCGHDGHAASMFRLAQKLKERPLENGRILLLFQSAEETGAGAKAIIASNFLKQFDIDYAFAYHNIPGFPLGHIISKEGLFTPCVESGVFTLTGATSHAAEPEKGLNPAKAISEIIQYLDSLNVPNKAADLFFLATPIHIEMGSAAYGTSAGSGRISYTFRTWHNAHFENIKAEIIEKLSAISEKHSLGFFAQWVESFKANTNSPEAHRAIINAAKTLNFNITQPTSPFEFGEDFGLFTQKHNGAMFGIGAGLNASPLHHAAYDFPDALIETSSDMFYQIAKQCTQD